MKQSIKAIVACITAASVTYGVIAMARSSQETIQAEYQNIQLVVDGVIIDPKDANGNSVEPFIYNGTTYLPVRAVGSAFDKDVMWEGTTSTVQLYTPVEKEKKSVALYNRPYLECGDANNIRSYAKDGEGYISCNPSSNMYQTNSGSYIWDNYVTYELNGKATTISGEFYVSSNANDATEGVLKIYNSSGSCIYTSPIMRNSTAATAFEVSVVGEQSVKLVFETTTSIKYSGKGVLIKNPTIVTSDY